MSPSNKKVNMNSIITHAFVPTGKYVFPLRVNFVPEVFTKPVTVDVEPEVVVEDLEVMVLVVALDVVVVVVAAVPGRHWE